jgi:hypothetical protein
VQTLDILRRLSPELPSLQLDRLISLISSLPSSSTVREREASVGRALEILEMLFPPSGDEGMERTASKSWEVLEATRQAGGPTSASEIVLEESASRLLGWVGQSEYFWIWSSVNCAPTQSTRSAYAGIESASWQASFASAILNLARSSASAVSSTSAVVIAALACEHASTLRDPANTCALLGRLLEGSSSGQ